MFDVNAAPAPAADSLMSEAHPAGRIWAEAADDCRTRLAALHAPTEEALLDLGERLRQAHGTARNLTAMAQALNHRLAESEFQRIIGDLDGTVATVETLRDAKTDHAERLLALTSLSQQIGQELRGLLTTMTHVKVAGVNAKIEAAHLSDGRQDFSIFTHEIERLAANGRETVMEASRELVKLHAAAKEGHGFQASFDSTQLRQLGEVSGRLRASLKAMRQRERTAAAALDDLPVVLEAAAGRIGAIVGGLQFGDIARQRIEHVETALGVMSATASGALPLPEVEGATLPVFIAAVCDLQVRQLVQVGEEFDRNIGRVLDDLGQLAKTIAEIRVQSEKVHSDGVDGGSSFLMAIDHELERVAAAVDGYMVARSNTEASLEQVGAAAAKMSHWIREISAIDVAMNRIGINAAIACVHLGGKGRALAVLAQELRTFARQTRGHSEAVAGRLGQVEAESAAISMGSGAADRERLQGVSSFLGHAVEQLRQCGGETAWVLSQIQEQSAAVVAAIDSALGQFSVHRRRREVIAASVGALKGLAEQATAGLAEAEMQDAKTLMLAFMEGHYTMETERDVHGSALGVQSGGAAAAEADLSDIFF